MIPERRSTVRRGLAGAGLCLLVLAAVRYAAAWWDLSRPPRLEAWKTIQDEHIRDFIRVVDDPRAVALWLAAGRDPNGNDCAADTDRPPSSIWVAVLRPIGLCRPDRVDDMPFIHAIIGPPSTSRTESIRLMLAAGVDVNEVSRDGSVPLAAAVLFDNVEVVRMLLDHGADPFAKPKHNVLGDYRSAMEVAQESPDGPAVREIRALLARAADRRGERQRDRGQVAHERVP